jgi:hypothetical protein
LSLKSLLDIRAHLCAWAIGSQNGPRQRPHRSIIIIIIIIIIIYIVMPCFKGFNGHFCHVRPLTIASKEIALVPYGFTLAKSKTME